MSQRERALALLARAGEDEALLDAVLGIATVSDSVFGFHCQQAAEKLLKAVLVHAGVAYRRTHDIAELLDVASDSGIEVAPGLDAATRLTPYAVEQRYEPLDLEDEPAPPLDRTAARELVALLRSWAEARVKR
jgi:HEPN domain-containing protein